MGRLRLPYKLVPADEFKYGKGFSLNSLSSSEFQQFNESILGLGDLSRRGTYTHALAAFFDLEGFTDFANQVDSHLVIPEFLNRYLPWLFEKTAEFFTEGRDEDRVRIWGSLPFYAKFLGDGVMFLWDTEYCGGESSIRNIVNRLLALTLEYRRDFLKRIGTYVSKPPKRLRCGIARGQVVSVGSGDDFVGSCLNIASRLQKLSTLSFAVSRRGIDLSHQSKMACFVLKKVELRGIGRHELVYVLQSELERLSEQEKWLFREP